MTEYELAAGIHGVRLSQRMVREYQWHRSRASHMTSHMDFVLRYSLAVIHWLGAIVQAILQKFLLQESNRNIHLLQSEELGNELPENIIPSVCSYATIQVVVQ